MNPIPVEVGVIGLWHLGLVTCAGLAAAGHRVVATDPDPKTVRRVASGELPVYEPGLAEALAAGVEQGRIRIVSDLDELRGTDLAWVTVDTPMREDCSVDLTGIDTVVEDLASVGPDTVLISSQLPLGTTRRYRRVLNRHRTVAVGYLPENLRLGSALADFARDTPILVGTDDSAVVQAVSGLFEGREIRQNRPESAELSKHATNSLLALTVTFANRIGDLARQSGADAYEVEANLRADPRFGSRLPLKPGPAFSGGTLQRDLRSLSEVSIQHGLPTDWIDQILTANDTRTADLLAVAEPESGWADHEVLLMGWVYKADTDSTRDAPGTVWAELLTEAGARVRVYEPVLDRLELAGLPNLSDLAEAVEGVHTVVTVRPATAPHHHITGLAARAGVSTILDVWNEIPEGGHPFKLVTPGRRPS